jgi:hypothetical protein
MTKAPATCTGFSLTLRKHATAAPLYKEHAAAAGQTARDLEVEDISMKVVGRHTPLIHAMGMILGSLSRLLVTGLIRTRTESDMPAATEPCCLKWSSLVEVEQDMDGKPRQETCYCVCGSYFQ